MRRKWWLSLFIVTSFVILISGALAQSRIDQDEILGCWAATKTDLIDELRASNNQVYCFERGNNGIGYSDVVNRDGSYFGYDFSFKYEFIAERRLSLNDSGNWSCKGLLNRSPNSNDLSLALSGCGPNDGTYSKCPNSKCERKK